jgi:hypothetical protein
MYKDELKKELRQAKNFEKNGYIPHDEERYKRYLKTLHHHEILPNRLYLIGRIQKSLTESEKDLWLARYRILQYMNPNYSWDEFVEKL